MRYLMLALALVGLLVVDASAGPFRRGKRGGCSGGQCGPQAQQVSFQTAPSPTQLTTAGALNVTQGQCGPRGGCR